MNRIYALLLLTFLFLTGCGDTSLFKAIADDNSLAAKKQSAQEALDRSDCQTAINLFTELQANDPNNVAPRLDLSAARLCAAGFSVRGFLDIAATFNTNNANTDPLFKKLIDQNTTVIPNADIWKTNVCESKGLLGKVTSATWPCSSVIPPSGTTPFFFNNDKDAGYLLSIVNIVDATLTVSNILSTFNSIQQCILTNTPDKKNCFTPTDLSTVVESLVSAQQSITASTGTTGVSQTINNILTSANTDGGSLSSAEVLNYLVIQKLINPSTTTAAGCTFGGAPPVYTCIP